MLVPRGDNTTNCVWVIQQTRRLNAAILTSWQPNGCTCRTVALRRNLWFFVKRSCYVEYMPPESTLNGPAPETKRSFKFGNRRQSPKENSIAIDASPGRIAPNSMGKSAGDSTADCRRDLRPGSAHGCDHGSPPEGSGRLRLEGGWPQGRGRSVYTEVPEGKLTS
jgi:hypothetical protein